MEKFKSAKGSSAEKPKENSKEVFPELLDEFRLPQESSVVQPDAPSADKEEAQQVLEKLKAAAPPPTPHEEEMDKERARSAEIFALRADERNKHRSWWEKLTGRGKVTTEDMAREGAEETYVQISNLKRSPRVYADGHSGPTYNSMAHAMRRGANESQLSEISGETNPGLSPLRGWAPHFAEGDARDVEGEKKRRRELGLPTDVLNREIEFKKAQEWEQKQREQKEKKAA